MAACGSIPMSYSVSNLTPEKSSWKHLWKYCEEAELDPYAAIDATKSGLV